MNCVTLDDIKAVPKARTRITKSAAAENKMGTIYINIFLLLLLIQDPTYTHAQALMHPVHLELQSGKPQILFNFHEESKKEQVLSFYSSCSYHVADAIE